MRLILTFAHLLYARRWWFIAAGLTVLVVGATYGVGVFRQLKNGGLIDPAAESARLAQQVERDFPDSRISLLLVLKSPTKTVDDSTYKRDARAVLDTVRKDAATRSILSYYDTQDARFVSRDRRSTYAVVSLKGEGQALTDAYLRIRSPRVMPATELQVTFGGPVVADYEIDQQVQSDLPRAEMISFPLLLILLLFIFRSVLAAVLPLFIGAVSILSAFALTRVFASFMDISVFAANIISLLGLGLAIDYSLLFVSRFRDELRTLAEQNAEGRPSDRGIADCLAVTLVTAGESIFFSGCTVAISLLGMFAFPESFLRSMGLGGALATVVAMLASLTILPAILAVLGTNVDRWRVPLPGRGERVRASERGFWFRFSHWVMDRAVLVIVVTLGILLLLGAPFLHTRFANGGPESLPDHFQSRLSAEALRRDFAVADNAPIQILVQTKRSPLDPAELLDLYGYVSRLRKLPGVQNVNSVVSVDPRIPPDGYTVFYSMDIPEAKLAKSRFVSGNATLISVDYKGESQDTATQELVKAIRHTAPPDGATVLIGGDTAELVDRLEGLRTHLPVAAGAIIAATLILLCVMLSSVFVPIKAVLLNVLSLSASFGLMTWIFQDGHLEEALGFTSSGSLDVTLPVLIFALAFGLSTDYEVFLVSRIKEEYHRTGDNTEAVAVGVEKTGEIITSAALLLIVVVAAFGASKILPMKEIGVGLSIAIAIDAAVVRTLLVPATMRVFGDLNWWLPFRTDQGKGTTGEERPARRL